MDEESHRLILYWREIFRNSGAGQGVGKCVNLLPLHNEVDLRTHGHEEMSLEWRVLLHLHGLSPRFFRIRLRFHSGSWANLAISSVRSFFSCSNGACNEMRNPRLLLIEVAQIRCHCFQRGSTSSPPNFN